MNIVEILENSMPLLTEKQKHIARYMLDNPSEMSFITLKDFSQRVGCTEATAIRFCQKIGLESFTDAKTAFRSVLAESSYEAKISGGNERVDSLIENENYVKKQVELEKEYFNQQIDNMQLEKASIMADEIIKAHTVYVIGRGTSLSIADFIRRRLALFGIRVYAVNPDEMTALQSAINRVSDKDLFIFLTFPMYYLPIINIARYVKEHGAKVLGFTDSVESLLTKHCDHYILTGEIKKGHYYSYASLLVFFNILLALIQVKLKDSNIMEFKNVLEEISHPDYQGSDYQIVTPI